MSVISAFIFVVVSIFNPTTSKSSNTQGLAYSKIENAIYTSETVSYPDRIEWLIRKSYDHGKNWKTVNSRKVEVTSWSAGGRGIAFNSRGTVFAIGRTEDAGKGSHWLVLRGEQFGTKWELVDDFTYFPAPGNHYAYHLAISRQNKVCVTGRVSDNTEASKETEVRWVVRCSDDDGNSWKNIDDEKGFAANGIAFDSLGNLYVAGMKQITGTPGVTGVMRVKKLNHGASEWKEMDLYAYAGKYTGAISAFVDSRNWIYVAGSGWENAPTQIRRWVLRQSKDGGKTWKTIDQFALDKTTYSEAYQVTETANGHLYVVGYAMDLNKKYHAIVRTSSDGGESWSTAADSLGPNQLGIYGHNITAAKNRVFASGGWYTETSRFSLLGEVVTGQ